MGKYGDARRLIEQLGDDVSPLPFRMVGAQHPPAAIGNAWVMGGPEADRAARAEEAMKAGDDHAALDEFRALAKAMPGEPQAKPYLDARVKVLERRVRYASGEWVDLQPVGDLVGWRQLDGQWEVRPDGSLAGSANPGSKRQHLICDDDFGDRFEISARVEVFQVKPADGKRIVASMSFSARQGVVVDALRLSVRRSGCAARACTDHESAQRRSPAGLCRASGKMSLSRG